MTRIAILASGSGTNAENIVRYFTGHPTIQVATVITNRRAAGVIDRLRPLGIEVEYFNKEHWADNTAVTSHLQQLGVDMVVLSGFLAMVGEPMLTAYAGRIVNIHPSLLPRHGGKGMYGHYVHESVLASGDKQSGITIHLVTDVPDGGPIVEQHTCPVMPDDTPDTLAARVHQLEYAYFTSRRASRQDLVIVCKHEGNVLNFIIGKCFACLGAFFSVPLRSQAEIIHTGMLNRFTSARLSGLFLWICCAGQ